MSASPLNFKITSVGLVAAANALATGIRIKFGNFKIGSGFGYTVTGGETAMQGTTLYEAPVTKYTDWVDGSLRVTLTIDPQAGPFSFGEVGLYTDAGILFALAVLPQQQTKYSSLNSGVNATFTFNCHLKLAQGTAIFDYPDYVNLDGSETKVTAGDNVNVSGSGSSGNPYVVSVPLSAIRQKINLEPEAGYGLDNTVPVSSAYPNALNPNTPTHLYMVDKAGQQTIFFTSASAFDTRKMARARIVDGNTVVEDRNYQIGGEEVRYILNGSRMSANLQTDTKILVLNPGSSSNPEEWALVADVTSAHAQTPTGFTGALYQSSFHYSPEFNKILRVALSNRGEIAFQILNTSGSILYSAVVFSINSVIDFTGGPSTTTLNPFGTYLYGVKFAYSYSKKELVFQTGSYNFFAGTQSEVAFKFAFNVPDAVWYGNFSGVTSQYPTYKYYVAGGPGNGVMEVNTGTAAGWPFMYSWDPFSNSYAFGRVSYWPVNLGDVDWSLANHTDALTLTYVPLPDATYIGKVILAEHVLLGANFIKAYADSYKYSWSIVNIPYSGTLSVEGNNSFNTKVASITPTTDLFTYHDASSGNRYSCAGLNSQVYLVTEGSTGWVSTPVAGKMSPVLPPTGFTKVDYGGLLYVSQLDKFIGLFYKNTDSRKYVYIVAFSLYNNFTVLSTALSPGQVDAYFTVTNGGLNSVYRCHISFVDNHLLCAVSYIWPGSARSYQVSAFTKASILNLTPNMTPVAVGKPDLYYPYACFSIGKDASGNFYTAEGVTTPSARILITKYANSDAYLASDKFVTGGPASTNKTWLTVFTTSGLALYVSSYPIFLGGYQCTIPQQSLTLKPNATSYLVATKTTDDKFTVQLSVVDYIPAGNSTMFDSFSQVCLCEVTTDSEKVTSKVDYVIRRDAQKLSKAGNILSISRGNSITL